MRRTQLRGVLVLLTSTVVITGAFLNYALDGQFQILDGDRMFFESVGYSLILWLVMAAFLWIRFERWAMVSRNRIRTLAANLILLAPLVVGLGYASFSLLNRKLDLGPATPHRLALYDALKMPYSKSARLNLNVFIAVVPSWRKPSEYENLRVSRAKFDDLWSSPGKEVVVTTRPGRFGYEWWESIERVPK